MYRVSLFALIRLSTKFTTFNEFTVGVPDTGEAALERAQAAGLMGGLDLAEVAAVPGPAVLVCTTELASRASIDTLVASLGGQA